jgi:beta-phosphoglucomutase
MSNQFQAVIWDVDGVLIDSEPLHLSSFMTTCAGYGFAFDAADNALWIGKSFTDIGVTDHLHTVCGRDDVAEGKPAPDLYLLAAQQLGVAPSDCLAIEDTESGLAAAKAAGLTAIVWPNEFNAVMDFSAADHVIDDLTAFDWDLVAGA